ncbi:hypothetical protein [Corynebacterium casei]|uniref:hypothetical protein n=1 Tax=Corynebacterium casei TaxID=160386 RepID=UPI003BB4F301
MFKKFVSIGAAGALAVGIAAPSPAMANPAVDSFAQSAQNSSQGFMEDPAREAQNGVSLSAFFPYMLSSMGSSLIGIEQCGLHDTRGCDDI